MKHIKNLSITNHINSNFRDYALYTLSSRGIPNFYDSLTHSQRLILLNAPKAFTKTNTLVGNVIADGFHHGDVSLAGSIQKITREFKNSMPLLDGDGWFGNHVSPDAAAPRYTSVRINPTIYKIIDKYKHLNNRTNGEWEPLRIEAPIGLLTEIIGIAVGYKTLIMPRKYEHILEFLNGKRKELSPSFIGFSGNITKFAYEGKDLSTSSTWLLEGKIESNYKTKKIHIISVPPVLKYSKVLSKIHALKENYDFTIQNNTTTSIELLLTVGKNVKEELFNEIVSKVSRAVKIIVTESCLFIKDMSVLKYDKIEDYLLDYSDYFKTHVIVKDYQYKINETNDEIEFLSAKKEFLEYMINANRNETEIETFLNKYNTIIKNKLDNIKLRHLSEDELNRTVQKIENEMLLLSQIKEKYESHLLSISDVKMNLRTSTKTMKKSSTLEDLERSEIDGIEIFTTNTIVEENEIDELNISF